jgi:hypothetical protein
MDKVLTFDDLSIGHRLGGRDDVTHPDRASLPSGESESLFASPSSLASGSMGGEFGRGVSHPLSIKMSPFYFRYDDIVRVKRADVRYN